MRLRNAILASLVAGSILTMINQWPALIEKEPVRWFSLSLTYIAAFLTIMFGLKKSRSVVTHYDEYTSQPIGVSPEHINRLYKQAIIVERNAVKANAAFEQQIIYIKNLVTKVGQLRNDDTFDEDHSRLVIELEILESRIEKLLTEMKKNVKLGEKLQQSIANIDPEIGIGSNPY